jgi:hypothetical protein
MVLVLVGVLHGHVPFGVVTNVGFVIHRDRRSNKI